MEQKYRAPRGTTDIVYPQSETIERLVEEACEILTIHGYQRISTPILESTELFRRSIGEETDIVNKEMYTFEDQGGESLTLRPEGTAPVVRAYIEKSLFSRGLPQRLYYFGPMFRRERPQAGRFRQFHQIGAEAIGSNDPFIDAEIISISALLFNKLNLRKYRLIVNSVGCRDCRPGYIEALGKYLEGQEALLCEQCRRRAKSNPFRVFDCKEESCIKALSDAPAIGDYLCERCRKHFAHVLEYLRLLSVSYDVDHRLVRGLDYYTSTAFEYQFEGLGAQNAVSAGGRYDYLAEELGGAPTPGIGFSLGIERLLLSLEVEGIDIPEPSGLEVFVAGTDGVDRGRLLGFLTDIRRAGISADADFMGRSLKSQMKHANRLGTSFAVIIGGDELERGDVVVRDLVLSKQWTVSTEEIVEHLRGLIRK